MHTARVYNMYTGTFASMMKLYNGMINFKKCEKVSTLFPKKDSHVSHFVMCKQQIKISTGVNIIMDDSLSTY